eukprot:80690_1
MSFSSAGFSAKRGVLGVHNDGDFTAEQIAEFREVFNWFDKNHDEFINEVELGNAMRALGENPTDAEITEILQSMKSTKQSPYGRMQPTASFSVSRSALINGGYKDDESKIPEMKPYQNNEEEIYRVAQHKIDFSQFLI